MKNSTNDSPTSQSDPRPRVRGQIRCPLCDKALSVETNDEECPKSLHRHGKHPIFIVADSPSPQQVVLGTCEAHSSKHQYHETCRHWRQDSVLRPPQLDELVAKITPENLHGTPQSSPSRLSAREFVEVVEFHPKDESTLAIYSIFVESLQIASFGSPEEAEKFAERLRGKLDSYALAQSAELRRMLETKEDSQQALLACLAQAESELARLRRELEQSGILIDQLTHKWNEQQARAEAAEKALQQIKTRIEEMREQRIIECEAAEGVENIVKAHQAAGLSQALQAFEPPLPSAPEKK